MTDLKVVMLVANDVTNDSRVRKEATALAATAAVVTVVGVSPDGRQSIERMDGVLLVRLAVDFPLRNERLRRRRARRAWRPPFLRHPNRTSRIARRLAIDARVRELETDPAPAPLRKLRRTRWRAARLITRLRNGFTRRLDRLFVLGWRVCDVAVSRVTWPARWRLVHPETYDYEFAFGDVIDRLQPDVVHAHDMHMIGVAVRAARRAKRLGRELRTVYDAHEYVPGLSRYGGRTPRFIAAWARHEKEYIRAVDRVITVSPAIARTLRRRYRLDHEPPVIINSPGTADASADIADLRSVLGLAADVALLVYSGGITRARGVETAVRALAEFPGVHLAVVCVPSAAIRPVDELRDLATAVGVADRVHCLDPVAPDLVVGFLRTADIGLIPLLRYPSHEMALPNKVFEYAFAGLPVISSDMPSLTEFLGRTGIGEVFAAGHPADLATAVRRVLATPERYRERLGRQDFLGSVSWERQADLLRDLYAELLERPLPDAPESRPAHPRLLIGPLNSAGQAWLWSHAVERHAAPATARSLMASKNPFGFEAHFTATEDEYSGDPRWQFEFTSTVLHGFSHVLFEAGRPLLGQGPGELFDKDLPALASAGIAHGVVLHGSEVRDPRRHRERYRYSPFASPADDLTARLQKATDLIRQCLAGYDGARFVTTPDLLEYVDDAEWLPVIVDPDELASPHPVLDRRIPVVLHAPSNSSLKGSAYIDPVLRELDERGVIEYRRVANVPQSVLKEMIKESDIVVDQLLLGSYGVFACEAMAAGRVTVGDVADHVRELLPTELPIVEANPGNLTEVIEQLLADRDPAVKIAAAGPDYVRRLHDGRESARVLQRFLSPELTL